MKKLLFLISFMLVTVSRAAAQHPDSLLLRQLFTYAKNYTEGIEGFQSNVYIKHLYQTHQRNFTLWCVPSMYAIARGQRAFVSEQYSRLTFKEDGKLDNRRQVYYTTIPHNRRTMPTLLEFITPRIYDETIYGDHILSPFNHYNRVFYRYTTDSIDGKLDSISFRPRYVNNTQLVKGKAIVERSTGRVIEAEMNGEFDMMHFQTKTVQGSWGSRTLLPKFCRTNVYFKFLGNHISSVFEGSYDCPVTLPDSVNVRGNRQLIDSVRPYDLSPEEAAIYHYRDSLRASRAPADTVDTDTMMQQPVKRKHNYLRDIAWEKLGESLIRSLKASNEDGYVRLSPIINPQYFSYSRRKGFSYRFKLGARYNLSNDVSLGMNTRFGYNFKQRKFYFNLPLRLDYSYRDRDAYAEVAWGSGNRIYNNTVIEELKRHDHNPLDDKVYQEQKLDQFDDWNMRIVNYLPLNNRLAIEGGIVFHQRKAVNKSGMRELAMPTEYRSLAPMLSVKTRPWRKGPLLTFDYERGLSGKNYLDYERWEIDASLKHRMHRLQTLNLRVGTGFYTRRDKNFFMDYSNFRDENLPEGWDDDWSGNFQLLGAHVYNMSKYYLRGNISFESPLMAVSFVPFAGRYVERERIYLSTLSVAHTRLYSELGYGFTCRYFSMGFFANFLNTQFQESGAKFTFELFRRW
ncbi:MAG: hypothetical protein J5797_07870 [Prevotella sp.]|nr:hypothetical protein [Prevotella sp.]